jgi:Zn-dependent peptidase ImmA (M78 family)
MTKKRFPTSIIILGRKFKIKQGSNLVYNEQPILGLCDYNKETIFLEKAQPEKSKRQTLVHEACHALLIITGMDQRLSESENEMYCQLLTAFCEDMKKVIE